MSAIANNQKITTAFGEVDLMELRKKPLEPENYPALDDFRQHYIPAGSLIFCTHHLYAEAAHIYHRMKAAEARVAELQAYIDGGML